jgi:hypothetical protein
MIRFITLRLQSLLIYLVWSSSWFTQFTVHRYTRTRIFSLHQSYPDNGIKSLIVTKSSDHTLSLHMMTLLPRTELFHLVLRNQIFTSLYSSELLRALYVYLHSVDWTHLSYNRSSLYRLRTYHTKNIAPILCDVIEDAEDARTQRKHCSSIVGRVCVADVDYQYIYMSMCIFFCTKRGGLNARTTFQAVPSLWLGIV